MKQEVFNYLDSFQITKDSIQEAKISNLKNYFDAFFLKYSSKDITKLVNISIKEIIEALVIISNPYKCAEINKLKAKYEPLFNKKNYNLLFIGFISYYHNNKFRNIIDNIINKNIISQLSNAYKLGYLCKELGLPNNTGTTLVTFFNKNSESLNELKVVFEHLSLETYNIGQEFIKACQDFQDAQKYDDKRNVYEQLPKYIKKQNPELITDYKNAVKNFTYAINEFIGFLNSLYAKVIKEYEAKEKERIRNNKNISKIKTLLDTELEIKNIDTILGLCPNTEVQHKVADYVIVHNQAIYEDLLKEYENKKQTTDENLRLIFAKYYFDYDKLTISDQNIIKAKSVSEIENLLSRLSNLSLNNVYITKVSLFKLETIEELVAKGLITNEWLKENTSLLYSDNEELEAVVTNIDLLSKEGINLILYHNSLDITKSSLLKSNLSLLRLYNLTITKSTTNISFLAAKDLRHRIEFMLSLNIINELNDLDILNYSLKDILKIKIANFLNLPLTSITSDYEELVCDFSSSLIPSEIIEKLNTESYYIVPLPENLTKYQINKQTLNINGVYVSIEKVKRNLAKIGQNDVESCFYAIIHNGYYMYEEIDRLCLALEVNKGILRLIRTSNV